MKFGSHLYGLNTENSDTGYILSVKRGELAFSEVSGTLEQLVEDINTLCESSNLLEEADREFWMQWVVGLYKQ